MVMIVNERERQIHRLSDGGNQSEDQGEYGSLIFN
jgi:hypothetical protein